MGSQEGLLFQLIDAYKKKDYPILKRHAHSLKGRVVQFGMETLRKKCYDL